MGRFITPEIFDARPLAGPHPSWVKPPVDLPKPNDAPLKIENEAETKRLFGIELAKNSTDPFKAACEVFKDDTKAALWASKNWLTDLIVIASRDFYLKTVGAQEALLDKDQLAAKVLAFAEEKVIIGDRAVYICEAKDRLGFLKLYSDIRGFTGKVDIDASHKTFVNASMQITFIDAEKEEVKTKTIEATVEEELNPLPMNIKLIG